MEKNYDHLIVRYLTDELSVEEQKSLMDWIESSAENKTYYTNFLAVWEASAVSSMPEEPNTEQAWETLKNQIQQESIPSHGWSVFRSTGIYQLAAASVILAIGLVYMVRSGVWSSDENLTRQTADRCDVFYLPDSSMVWLNKHSSITYTASFDGQERVVYLNGQAFFDVKRRPEQPFIIHASGTTTKVLGTSFDLRAYPQQDVELTVVTGKVSFTAQQQTLLLLPTDKGIFRRKENTLALQPHDTAEEVAVVAWVKENSYQGNSIYEAERSHPKRYLHHTFEWHSNLINQSVIEGTISSSARVCLYDTLHLRATYVSKKDKVLYYPFVVIGQLLPGGSISYKKRLPDWFKDTKEVRIAIEKVEGGIN